ncbi:MAG: hypothetical protein HRT35_23350 [Algicola sp.]|nr:hypothetical protein [Algicola sp.]
MDISSLMTAGVVGNLAYDLLKNGLKFSAELLREQAKAKTIEWLYDDEATEKIANRVNELTFAPSETPDQYCQRLDEDVVLKQLLKQFAPANQVIQTINNSDRTRMAGGDYHENHTHYHGTPSGDTSPKKP